MNNTIPNRYAAIIHSALADVINEKIDADELIKDDNLTHFIHALANLVPTSIYREITGDKVNILEFNHIANSLCFQYGNIERAEE